MKNPSRIFRRLCALTLLTAFCMVQAPQAQSSGGYSGGGNYEFSLPGYHGVGGGTSPLFDASFNASGGFDLGCGGIGLFDFIKSTFNLSNIIEQFKASMSTMLAKTLMTQLMSVPQLAALFDTLNAFGNARFDLFQQGCDMGEIQKEARQICIDRCIAKGEAPATCEDIKCRKGGDVLDKVSSELKKKLYENENVNEAMRGVLCNDGSGDYAPKNDSCFIMSLIPQFRLCLRSSIGEKCTGNYGARESVVSIANMRDAGDAATSRFIGRTNDYFRSAPHLAQPRAIRYTASRNAVLRANKGEKAANCGETSTPANVQRLVKEYKTSIGCKQEQPLNLVCLYAEELEKLAPSGGVPRLNTDVDISDIEDQFGENLTGDFEQAYGKDLEGLKEVLKVGTACMMNNMGSTDPFLWNEVADADPGTGNSMVRALGNEGGYRLGMSIATFTINMLNGKYPEVSLDQQTRNPLAKQAEEEADGETDADKEVELENAKVIKEAKQNVIRTAVDNLERWKKEATEQYKAEKVQQQLFQDFTVRANGARMNNGVPPGVGLY